MNRCIKILSVLNRYVYAIKLAMKIQFHDMPQNINKSYKR